MPFTDNQAVMHTPAPTAQLLDRGASGQLIAHGPFEVTLPGTALWSGCAAPTITFERRFPIRLRGKLTSSELSDMVGDIQSRLNEAVHDAHSKFQSFNIPILVTGTLSLGIAFMFTWPLWLVAQTKAAKVLESRMQELNEFIDEQNEQYWIPRGIQFSVQRTLTRPSHHQCNLVEQYCVCWYLTTSGDRNATCILIDRCVCVCVCVCV
jgi:hypothetical protein